MTFSAGGEVRKFHSLSLMPRRCINFPGLHYHIGIFFRLTRDFRLRPFIFLTLGDGSICITHTPIEIAYPHFHTKNRANIPFDDEDLREYVETSSAKKVTKTKKNKSSSSNMPPISETEEHFTREDAQPITAHLTDHKTSRLLKDNESTVSKRLRSPVRSGLLCGAKFHLYSFPSPCLGSQLLRS